MVYDIGVAPSTPPSVGKIGGGNQEDNDDLTAPLVSTPLSEVGEGENRNNLGGSSSSPPSSPFCYPKTGNGQYGPFFDMDSTLDIPAGVARGYMVLLTGGKMKVPTVGGRDGANKDAATKLSAKVRSRLSLTRANSKNDGSFPTAEGLEVQLSEGDGTEQEEVKEGDKDNATEDKSSSPARSVADRKDSSSALSATLGVSVTEVWLEDPADGSVEVAFMALTDGNVIDACFGVRQQAAFLGLPSPRRTGGHSKKAARNAKELLREASESHEAIRLLAVEAYARAFEIVMKYHKSLEDNGIVGWCWKAKKIRDKSVRDLISAFDHLTGAVEATL